MIKFQFLKFAFPMEHHRPFFDFVKTYFLTHKTELPLKEMGGERKMIKRKTFSHGTFDIVPFSFLLESIKPECQ